MNLQNNILYKYGWNSRLEQFKAQSSFNHLPHGRVTAAHKTCYDIISEDGPFSCELSGNYLFGKAREEFPTTGDWVLFQPFGERKGLITDMIPRERALFRRKSGSVSERQVIASWLDKVFIVQGLDNNYNLRRAERFIVQVRKEGIEPVLVFTKTDLGADTVAVKGALKHLHGIESFFTSILEPESIAVLKTFVKEGETVVFTGSSGVGKSSLINALFGERIFEVSEISSSTGKGMHTSTRREMVLLEGSGVLIDTPGVREFGLVSDSADTISEVLNISELEEMCRYSDCSHTGEPGCAVIEAVENGRLERSVYESYLKLRRETWHFTASEHEKRMRDKSFSGMVEEVKKLRKKY